MIKINNNDDKPLKIKNVKASQLNTYLTASLENGNDYTLRFGDEKLEAPVYDLKYFVDSIPQNLAQLAPGSVNGLKTMEDSKSTSVFNSTYIWIALGVVIIFLGFMSYRMLKEMK